MIQDMRKEADYHVTDRIEIALSGFSIEEDGLEEFITAETLSRLVENIANPDLEKIIADEEMGEVTIMIKR